MTLWQGSKPELVTALAAALCLPFYLGLVHAHVPQLAIYSGVAAAAMATGELAETPAIRAHGLRLFLIDVAIWAVVIGLLGAIAYTVALIF